MPCTRRSRRSGPLASCPLSRKEPLRPAPLSSGPSLAVGTDRATSDWVACKRGTTLSKSSADSNAAGITGSVRIAMLAADGHKSTDLLGIADLRMHGNKQSAGA